MTSKKYFEIIFTNFVREVGLEPTTQRARLLRPLCMPIPPLAHMFKERLTGHRGPNLNLQVEA